MPEYARITYRFTVEARLAPCEDPGTDCARGGNQVRRPIRSYFVPYGAAVRLLPPGRTCPATRSLVFTQGAFSLLLCRAVSPPGWRAPRRRRAKPATIHERKFNSLEDDTPRAIYQGNSFGGERRDEHWAQQQKRRARSSLSPPAYRTAHAPHPSQV